MKTFHVSPAQNLTAIQREGLLPNATVKNFTKCRPLVYVSPNIASAKQWAKEIARETGIEHFSLFEVSTNQNIVYTVTSIGELQGTISTQILANDVRLLENFATEAAVSIFAIFGQGVPGFVYCQECERNVEDTMQEKLYHIEEFHNVDEL